MPQYSVPLTSWANISVTVETEETDPEKIAELAQEQAGVSLCHQCAGKHGLDVGDEWAPVRDGGTPEVYKVED